MRHPIKQFKEELCDAFCQNISITAISHKLASFIDQLLSQLFHEHDLDSECQFCILALGSYGRRELMLHSDIDLLVLHAPDASKKTLQKAQQFIQACWDSGLCISHQLTTVDACAELASQDISVISSILDMHLVCGVSHLMEELLYQTQPLHMWTTNNYFFAKVREQNQRYSKYNETAYNLEPNVKTGPGGLRDLQTLLSIAKRHFAIKKIADGISCGFITDKEYEELMHSQQFLWRVRFALHMIAQKNEDRLLFDHQMKLAQHFGYLDNEQSLAIEQFMKSYFKEIKRVRELNDMLLQWFAETIVYQQKQKLIPLDDCFQLANNYIEVRHAHVFIENPVALLRLFLWMAKHPNIEGARAGTIRLIRQQLYLINQQFRQSKPATDLFLSILKTAENPYEVLQFMSRYGVLGHYLQCFAAVTGQMQYDLFHVYTVEQHTLFVIRNIARFLNPQYQAQFPLGATIMQSIQARELLYVAALFHDIAKGRGGDHALLGAMEVEQFATHHHFTEEQRALVVWLVQNHLLMSKVAQRQDIYDPKTIANFSNLIPQPEYLDYLYLLTVADICGTNPTLWNSWRDSLLKELYFATKQAMQQERTLPDENSLIALRQQQALDVLLREGCDAELIQSLWQAIQGIYFLHESPQVIARHTKAILTAKQFPLVLILPHHSEGGTEVFIYMPHRADRFAISTTVLSNHQVTIQEATVLTCDNQFDLDTYIILDDKNQTLVDEKRTQSIQQALISALANNSRIPQLSRRRIPQRQAHFKRKPQILFSEDAALNLTCLFLITEDRPGLLANISHVFFAEKINLHQAKIATAGERVEDVFYICNQQKKQLSPKERTSLRNKLIGLLSS